MPILGCLYTDSWVLLLCAADSTCQLYQNPSYSVCYLDTTILAQKEKKGIIPTVLVSPNPVDTHCNVIVSGTEQPTNTLRLFDCGSRLVRNEIHNENSFVFERNNLPSGLYYMQVICGEIILNKRIILN
jgi:hypothetical protein